MRRTAGTSDRDARRHPIEERALGVVEGQVAVGGEQLTDLITTAPDLSRRLAERLPGLAVSYASGPRVPDQPLPDGGTLFTRLRDGGHVPTPAGLVRPDGHLVAAGQVTAGANSSE